MLVCLLYGALAGPGLVRHTCVCCAEQPSGATFAELYGLPSFVQRGRIQESDITGPASYSRVSVMLCHGTLCVYVCVYVCVCVCVWLWLWLCVAVFEIAMPTTYPLSLSLARISMVVPSGICQRRYLVRRVRG